MLNRFWLTAALALALGASGCGGGDGGGAGGSGGSVGPGGSGGGGTGGEIPAQCGNGILEEGEACDDGDANSDTEPDACRTDCSAARCGDGVIDTGEACDDENTVSGDGCSADCQLEARCGNGTREGEEECDGGDLGGKTCLDFGHNSGTVTCTSACTIDTSACRSVEFCDNGVDDDHDGLADCDDPECDDDLVNCGPRCGDGVVNREGEECDGNDIPKSCVEHGGYQGGTMGCTDACTFDPSNCIPVEDCSTPDVDEDGDGFPGCDDPDCVGQPACVVCGDGIVGPGEQCDTVPPQGMLCANYGTFNAGTLRCNEFCEIDTSECTLIELCGLPGDDDGNGYADCEDPACNQRPPCPVCGNGVVEDGEECDDGNQIDRDGCSPSCRTAGVGLPPIGTPIVVSGSIDSTDPTYLRAYASCTASTNNTHYDVLVITNYSNQPQVAQVTAAWTGGDGYLLVYSSFDPSSPTSGCVTGNDDYNGTSGSRVSGLYLAPGQSLYVIATTLSANVALGPYTLTVETLSVCGDGTPNLTYEGCDDGNLVDGDGCSSLCRAEFGWVCENGTDCRQTVCGDGVVEGYEECESGPNCTEQCFLLGNSCLAPLVIGPEHYNATTGTWSISGDSSQYPRTFSASCTSSQGKRDAVVAFTPPETGRYSIDYQQNYDGVLMVWQGGCDPATGTQLYCADSPEYATLDLTAGETIYIIADGWGSSVSDTNAGPFTIVVSRVN